MSFTKLSHLSNYYNDRDLVFTVSAHDLLGNEMFELQKFYYKKGQHVHWSVPQFEDYYVEEVELDFCIEEDTNIELTYKHMINAHIDITNDDDKVVYCGPVLTTSDELQYFDRGEVLHDAYIQCMFEGMEYHFKYPVINGYYTDDEYVHLTLTPWTVLHKKYHKIEPVIIKFVNEEGEVITTKSIDLTEEIIKANMFTYTPVEVDFDDYKDEYYYRPEDYESEEYPKGNKIIFKLNPTNNTFDILLRHWRYVHLNYTKHDTNTNSISIETKCDGVKYKIGDSYKVIIENKEGDDPDNKLFYTDNTEYETTVGTEYTWDDEHNGAVYNINTVHYYNYITFHIYSMYNGTEIGHEDIRNCKQDVTYYAEPLTIDGYYTHTGIFYLRGTCDRTLHIEYHTK